MSNPLERALQDARRHKSEGRSAEAEESYGRAAELARSCADDILLAHALRHLSDLARERGANREARERALEAVQLYRGTSDPLGLANALRLQALSAEEPLEAADCWRRARELYASVNVAEGVAECTRYLGE